VASLKVSRLKNVVRELSASSEVDDFCYAAVVFDSVQRRQRIFAVVANVNDPRIRSENLPAAARADDGATTATRGLESFRLVSDCRLRVFVDSPFCAS
jgi:hypothetical protein